MKYNKNRFQGFKGEVVGKCWQMADGWMTDTCLYYKSPMSLTGKGELKKGLLSLFLLYEGCSKWIAYFYLETSNFKLAQKYSFYALEVLPVARIAKFQPMYPLLGGVTVRWFGHSNKVLMNGRSKCLSGLVFPPNKECFQFQKQKEITWGKVWEIRGLRQNSYFFFLQKRRNYCGGMSWGIVM